MDLRGVSKYSKRSQKRAQTMIYPPRDESSGVRNWGKNGPTKGHGPLKI